MKAKRSREGCGAGPSEGEDGQVLEQVDLGGVACDSRVEEAEKVGEVGVDVGEEELDKEVEEPCDGSRGRPSKLTVSPVWKWLMTSQVSGMLVRQNSLLANCG